MQCPSCGRRFREPRCPTHGAPIAAVSPRAEQAPPSFPGYEVLGVLGQGGFGTVYEVAAGGARLAIKTAHRSDGIAGARLRREAEALGAIGPPHVPRLHATGELDDGTAWLAMELVALPTLADVLADRAPLAVAEALGIARALVIALRAAHALGYVHRDLKPENVFIGDDLARIVDFGLVKLTSARAADTLTPTGAIVGSAVYMSPEQSAGRADLDPRSDLYAVGVLLHEMLAGRPPFLGSAAELMLAHISRRPPRLAVPPALDAVVQRCLMKAREDRPASADELLAALADVDASAAVGGAPAEPPRPAPARPGAGAREKRTVGLLFFRSARDARTVQSLIASFGGQMARADGSFAAVFDHDAGDNPARRAVLAAQAVVDGRLAPAAVIDTGAVTVLARPDGSRRYTSPLFTRAESYPAAGDPPGVLITGHSAELIADLDKEPAGARGLLRVARGAAAGESRLGAIVGRDEELAALRDLARGAAAGAPTIATVLAAAGAGKSHLAAALVEALDRDLSEVEILAVQAREPAGGEGLLLRELLGRVLGLPAERPDDAGRALLAERLGLSLAEEVWPGVAVALGWAGAGDEAVRARAAAPGALRAAAARALGLALRQRAQDHPVALVLDDAHHADEASLAALELAALEEGGAALFVCALARPGFVAGRADWGTRAAAARRLELAPLAPEAAAELCARLLEPARDVPRPLVERLLARTQGLPLLLAELVRGLKRDGHVRRHEHGDTWYLASDALDALPDLPLVDWMAGRELASLSSELAQHARLLALLGGEVDVADAAGVLARLDEEGHGGELPLDAAVSVARLAEVGLLVAGDGGRPAFRSAVLREAIERATPAALAAAIHEAAYRHHRDGGDPRRRAALAHHAARCGRRDEAFAGWVALATAAAATHAFQEAERCFGRALEQEEQAAAPEAYARALRGRGVMRYRLARYDDALPDLRRARELAVAAGDRPAEVDLVLDEARVLDWLEDYHASRDLVARARELARALEGGSGPLLEARLGMALGRIATIFDQGAEAAAILLDAAARAEALGDEGYETRVIALLLGAWVLANQGRLDESEAVFARVIELCAGRGDRVHLGAALGNRTALWTARGEPERAVADLNALLEIAREDGNTRMESGARAMLADNLYYLGHLDDAERHCRSAIEVVDRRMGAAARLEHRLWLARILAVKGDRDGAAAVLADIESRLPGAALIPLEEVALELVRLLVRGGAPDAWRALVERARGTLVGPEFADLERLAAAAQLRLESSG